MDNLEQNGLAAAAAGGSRTITLNTPIPDNPQLEAIRQGLQRDYTQKTHEAKAERERAEQLLQQAQILQQQAQLVLQSQQTGAPQQPMNNPPDISEAFEQRFGSELDPGARQMLGFMAEYLSQPQAGLSKELMELKGQMNQLIQQQRASQSTMQALAVRPELEALADTFGQEELMKRMPKVAQLMNGVGLSFKQALAAVDPDFYAERMAEELAKKSSAQKQAEDDRIARLIGVGSLEGVIPTPSAEGTNAPQYTPGESFAESMKKMLGVSAYQRMLSEDAISHG